MSGFLRHRQRVTDASFQGLEWLRRSVARSGPLAYSPRHSRPRLSQGMGADRTGGPRRRGQPAGCGRGPPQAPDWHGSGSGPPEGVQAPKVALAELGARPILAAPKGCERDAVGTRRPKVAEWRRHAFVIG